MPSTCAKVVLVGKSSAGKTSLLHRYAFNTFTSLYHSTSTIGSAFQYMKENIDGTIIELAVWDTAGSERYESMSPMYYRGAFAAIVCYDITDTQSWEDTSKWIEKVNNINDTCRFYLCATKADLLQDIPRPVSPATVQQFACQVEATVFETSAKTGENIQEIFHQIAQDFVEQVKSHCQKEKVPVGLKLVETMCKSSGKTQEKFCC